MVSKDYFGEGKNIEFKQEIPSRHEKFLKDIIAFANTSGGKCIIGIVDETNEVVGIGDQSPFKLSDSISSMISDACTPLIESDIYPDTVEGKTVLVVEVFPGKQRPYYLASKKKENSSYIRINGTSRPADPTTLRELELEGAKLSYDTMQEIGMEFDGNKAEELCKTVREVALSNCETEDERLSVKDMNIEKLENIGLLCRTGGKYAPTHAFALMTDNGNRFAKVQCAVFKGTDRDVFIDKKEFDGPIYEQLSEGFQFILRHINTGARVDGLYRNDIYELPIKAVRELLANAIIHRSYITESKIQVSIFDDRLEIVSPGMLYGGISFETMKIGKSKCRNQAIADIFQYMRIVEAWGTGIPRSISAFKKYGLHEPCFEEFGDGIKVTVLRMQANDKKQTTKASSKKQTIKANDKKQTIKTNDKKQTIKMQKHVDVVVAFLQEVGEAKTADIAEKLGLSPDRTRVILAGMSELEALGSNRNRTYRLK